MNVVFHFIAILKRQKLFLIHNKCGHRNVLSKRQVWMSIFHIINFKKKAFKISTNSLKLYYKFYHLVIIKIYLENIFSKMFDFIDYSNFDKLTSLLNPFKLGREQVPSLKILRTEEKDSFVIFAY
jgi:hypothetical protein